ncbi:MAG: hypothetical protein GC131_09540 [Alphaproteobacteria bacterium]|nr:hypothetical protein [Alphaproteobacteria bacterium]
MIYLNFPDRSFQKDEQGNLIYYPVGRFGKGYVVPSDIEKEQIKKKIAKGIIIPVVIFIVAALVLYITNYPPSAVFLIVFGFAANLYVRKKAVPESLEASPRKFDVIEARALILSVVDYSILIVTILFFSFAFALQIPAILKYNWHPFFVAVAAFIGLSTIYLIYMLTLKIRLGRKNKG